MPRITLSQRAFETIRDIDGPDPNAKLKDNVVRRDDGYEVDVPQPILDMFNKMKDNPIFGSGPDNESFSDTVIRLAHKMHEIFGPKPFEALENFRKARQAKPVIH